MSHIIWETLKIRLTVKIGNPGQPENPNMAIFRATGILTVPEPDASFPIFFLLLLIFYMYLREKKCFSPRKASRFAPSLGCVSIQIIIVLTNSEPTWNITTRRVRLVCIKSGFLDQESTVIIWISSHLSCWAD